MRLEFRHVAPGAMALTAALISWPADAQDAVPPSGEVEEVIVTAQRREERSQDVPITITAFSSERLQEQNITAAQSLSGVVPSLMVSALGQASREVQSFTLRGVRGSYQGGSAVVVYLNEVPLPEGFTLGQQGGPGNYIDLENVQVLAGPQGTLFGRNTVGGAVLLVPKKPTGNFEGSLQASTGNYSYRGFDGVLNVPVVSEKLLVRLAATYQDREGFTRDLVWNKDRDDLHYYAGRIGVTFKPTDRFENYLMAYGANSDTNGSTYINLGVLIPGALAQRQGQLAQQLGPRATRIDADQLEETKTWGVIDRASFELSDTLTLNNIIGYQRFRKNYAIDEDGTPLQLGDFGLRFPTFPIAGLSDEFGIAPNGFANGGGAFGPRDDLKLLTEELQLQGKALDDRLDFTAGVFYLKQSPAGDHLNRSVFGCAPQQTGSCAPLYQTYGVSNESKAVYAQSVLGLGGFSSALEAVRLTAGYRYTWDTIEGESNTYIPFGPGFNYCLNTGALIADPSVCATGRTLKSTAGTWRIGVDYKPVENALLFANVSRGYKAGGYNPFAVRLEALTFEPEEVTAFELGVKADWHLGAVPLRTNLTAYSLDYDPIQRGVPDLSATGVIGSRQEAAELRIQGVEAEFVIQPIRALELGGNIGYGDAEYKNYSYTAIFPTQACNGLVPVGGTVDKKCEPYSNAKLTYSANASVKLPVPETWGDLSLFASYAHVSKQVMAQTEPGGILEPYGLLNASANWRSIARSNLDLEVFVTNATDKLYRISNSNISSVGFYSSIYGEPRMYGARLRYRFGQE